MQKNPMDKNREEKSMSCRTTSINLNQRAKEKIRKAYRSINDKCIQKCTSLYRKVCKWEMDQMEWQEIRKKKKIMSLGQLVRGDLRIETPLDRSISNKWHNVIKEWRLIVRINRMLEQWHPKSISHNRRGNGVPYTPYLTPH